MIGYKERIIDAAKAIIEAHSRRDMLRLMELEAQVNVKTNPEERWKSPTDLNRWWQANQYREKAERDLRDEINKLEKVVKEGT